MATIHVYGIQSYSDNRSNVKNQKQIIKMLTKMSNLQCYLQTTQLHYKDNTLGHKYLDYPRAIPYKG